ncbi:MFS transporter [Pyruvatibacter mobilis]|uniref:MFS transporter n=1 Tax=Pyruvatibacter mobilis TaxID=1712261 RepID=UPI003BAAC6A1
MPFDKPIDRPDASALDAPAPDAPAITRVTEARRLLIISSIVAVNMLSLAATDLYLPSIPELPRILGASVESVQFTLVTFSLGFAFAQILIGALGDVFSRRAVLVTSMLLFIPATVACALAPGVEMLITARLVQGASAAAGAALTAPLIRDLFSEERAVQAMSVIGGIDAVIPAFAPIVGAWVFTQFGWEANFWLVALLALPATVVAFIAMPSERQSAHVDIVGALTGYSVLLKSPAYLGYALSHAIAIAGLLTLVFSLPVLLDTYMEGGPREFILTQILWVGSFLGFTWITGIVSRRIGVDPMIRLGSLLQIGSSFAVLAYVLLAGTPLWWMVALLATPVCIGFGLRAGAGFAQAMRLFPSHAARASSFILFVSMLAAAAGTGAVAPFLEWGLWSAPVAMTVSGLAGHALLRLTRRGQS